MHDQLLKVLLPYLSEVDLVDVDVTNDAIGVRLQTGPGSPVACPACGTSSTRVHSRYQRRVADLPIGGRPVYLHVQVRRLYCRDVGCPKITFAEQIPGVTETYQQRTPGMRRLLQTLARQAAGRASARLAAAIGVAVSWSTMLRLLLATSLPEPPTPRVLSVDDFAVRRGRRYASLLLDAVTHQRVDVLPDRKAATLTAWLAAHPGVEIVCRDGSATYAQAITDANTAMVQASDRWHLWHNLAIAVDKTVAAHASCWNSLTHTRSSAAQERTRRRFAAVRELTDVGVGLLETARRLGWSLNTVKRYARADTVEQLLRPPRYGRCLVDDHRDLVQRRLSEGMPVTRILAEIRAAGYTGSANLLVRYIRQGRAAATEPVPSPRRLTSWIMARPSDMDKDRRRQRDRLTAACPEMTALAKQVQTFAVILTRRRGSDLPSWIETTQSLQLPGFNQFLDGLVKDQQAAIAGLTLPYSNGPIEGANTKVKLLKRQMYGRAGFRLLRHRILLN